MPKYNLLPEVRQRLDSITHCLYCGSTEALTVDHITPRCKGGKNGLDNVTKACEYCNSLKSSHDIPSFLDKVLNYRFTTYFLFKQTLLTCRREDDEEIRECLYDELLQHREKHSYYTRIIHSLQNNLFIIHD